MQTDSLELTCGADLVDGARVLGPVGRLYGIDALERLRRAHVMVVGVGGVGSWAAEALARTGVGRLTLVDLDIIAESNLNRQVHAARSTLGASKVEAMRARIADIAPGCEVLAMDAFLTPENVDTLHAHSPSVVIDACDQMTAKVAMARWARTAGSRLVICGAAGGRRDPTRLRRGDLALATHDPLLTRLRSQLRRIDRAEGRFAAGPDAGPVDARAASARSASVARGGTAIGRFALTAIWSDEPRPRASPARDAEHRPGAPLACAGYGSVVMVTGAMGFVAAASAVEEIFRFEA